MGNVTLLPWSALRENDPDRWREISASDADAFCWSGETEGKKVYLICYNDAGMPARIRFTLAHELGHLLMNHHDRSDEAAEREADCFAQHLLLPRPAVCRLLKNRSDVSREELERLFFVSSGCVMRLSAETYAPAVSVEEALAANALRKADLTPRGRFLHPTPAAVHPYITCGAYESDVIAVFRGLTAGGDE